MSATNPDYSKIEKRIETYLVESRHEFLPTGSRAFFGEGADMDYVIDFNNLPDNIKADLVSINDYADEQYPDAFINFKIDEYDFIIQKSTDNYKAWVYATNKVKGSITYNKSVYRRIRSDKEHRVNVFEFYKEQYLNNLS